MVHTEEAIAYAEICVYVPVFLLTLIVVFRHGFKKQLGWIYLAIFCVIRIAGAGFKIQEAKSPNKTNTEWAGILQSVGLSPLLMASLGLLKRVTDEVSDHVRAQNNHFAGTGGIVELVTKRATASSRRSRIIQVMQLPTIIALILCIAGGTDQAGSSPSEVKTGKKDTKIGIIIFLFVYLLLSSLVVITMKDIGKAMKGETRIYFAVVCALPWLAVRLLWSLLSAFSHNPDFSLTRNKKPLIQLFMAVVEEFVIVCMYTLAGLTAQQH
ncbi:hypothetical protein ONS95_010319 [Cadophora gregata]|uniref:uncharacterized protein n=1 Tax=Cadophora gregata TaxID=51156 RepID=UPI0026DC9C31|nr:uncharacterized protein ONS95_010319 [Cadophora gregata]KAK0122055.1 hypothetical protein ONS95_010319 [Cadophora gregata]